MALYPTRGSGENIQSVLHDQAGGHDIIVKQTGGTIHVETKPGVFTEFVITLPRATSAQKSAGSA
jgi:hypothetical protein